MQVYAHNVVIELLVSPRLRFFRHLILFAFTFSISAGLVWFVVDKGASMNSFAKYGGLLFFSLILLGGSYFNIYVLTPKLLLRNKWGTYFCSLVGVTLPILVLIVLVQTLTVESEEASLNTDATIYFTLFRGIINLLSSSLSFFLLLAGTSTLVLFKFWILDMRQSEDLESATLHAELKLLENQVNPHFLFNMLNNANIMIKKDPNVAIHIIEKLEEMLRYLMNDNIGEKVYLTNEISFLNDFLELENTRRDQFSYTILKEGEVEGLQIPPLLFIPFVENAVKHNRDSRTTSYVHILFRITKGKLIFMCENSIPQRSVYKEVGGIGLTNIRRRLNLLYKKSYSLEQTETDTSYTVKLELKL